MEIRFTKMHGIGNDYIYINCMERELPDPAAVSVAMSQRHFSVGSDGIVMICPSDIADVKMRIFNADGSEAKMCGNGIRCVGKFVYDKNIVKKKSISVETLSGIKQLSLTLDDRDGEVSLVTVDMGKADFAPEKVPLKSSVPFIDKPIEILGKTYRTTCLSMGNPHAVVYVDDPEKFDLLSIGPLFETHTLFPDRINTEFIRVIDRRTIKMRVWERGSGETFACGTGACATVVASVKLGLCDADVPITVKLLGGDLQITCMNDWRVFMTGPAETVYEGIYQYKGMEK